MTEFEDPSVPQYYYALNAIGIHYDNLRWLDMAEECYLKASKRNLFAKFNYASILLHHNKSEKSKELVIDLLNEYVDACPDDCDGFRDLAKAYGWKNTSKRQEMNEKAFEKGWSGDFFDMLQYNVNNLDHDTARQKNNEIANKLYDRFIEYDGLNDTEEKQETIKSLSPKVGNHIGLFIFNGNYLIKQDYIKACKIWEITIKMQDYTDKIIFKNNVAFAKYNLAISYSKGEGVAKDKTKAFELLMQCQEDPDAQREIGNFYYYGWIHPVSKGKAKEWYVRAANNNFPDYESCLNLARSFDLSVKEKAQYFLKGIKRESVIKNTDNAPKSHNIPTDVLLYYEAKIAKLKRKLVESECRPPEEGGRLYLEAKSRFETNAKGV